MLRRANYIIGTWLVIFAGWVLYLGVTGPGKVIFADPIIDVKIKDINVNINSYNVLRLQGHFDFKMKINKFGDRRIPLPLL